MTTLRVYFEQRLIGTIEVDKRGPGFTYDSSWIDLRGAFPISITMPFEIGAHLFRHFPALGSKFAPRERAAAHSRTAPRDGAERCNRSAVGNRRRHCGRTLNWPTWENRFSSMATGG